MKTRPLDPDEMTLLSNALEERGQHRDRLFLVLSTSTGFRVSELLTLRFCQIMGPEGRPAKEISITRRLMKGGHGAGAKKVMSRRVVLNATAREAIAVYISTLSGPPAPDDFVFASRKGENRPINRGQAYLVLKNIAREVGIDATRVGCHSTRKTYARGIYDGSGHDLVATQRSMGHSSPLTTAQYLDTSEAVLDKLVMDFDPMARAVREASVRSQVPAALRVG